MELYEENYWICVCGVTNKFVFCVFRGNYQVDKISTIFVLHYLIHVIIDYYIVFYKYALPTILLTNRHCVFVFK